MHHWVTHAMLFYYLACDENKELCKQDVLQLKLRFWSIKFPIWKMLISVELDVAPCWHADPIMNHSCSQLQHALRSKVGILVFLSPNRLSMIPCIRWICFTIQLLAQSSVTLRHVWKSLPFCVPLVILQSLYQPGWTSVTFDSWAPTDSLFLYNFILVCSSLNLKSLCKVAKKCRCGPR